MTAPNDEMGSGSRRGELLAAKLGALIGDAGLVANERPVGIGLGAAAMIGPAAWVLLDSHPERGLGPAIAWALRHGADSLHILTDRGAGTIARRAALFDWPVQVSQLIDRSSSPAAPVGREVEPVVAEAHLGFTELIAAAGAQPVHEFGVLAGEVAGLEVCRVVDDAASGEARLDIGVGAADRETFQMLHAGRAQLEALSDVVVHVRAVRSPGADRHPLNQLAASRLLRDRLVLDASAIGLGQVVPVSPPTPRANLKDEVPCVALSADGTTVVVCSAGIDLDVVPFALDAASLHSAQRCLIVVAERDIVDIQRRLASLAMMPTTFVAAPATAPVEQATA